MDLADALQLRSQKFRPNAEAIVGTVVSILSGMRVTVDIGDFAEASEAGEAIYPTVPRLRSYSPIVGDVVLMVRSGGALYCVGALNATPPPNPDPPPTPRPPSAPARPTSRTRSFRPVSTGSFRSGSWRGDTSDLYQGDWTGRGQNFGAAHYGNGPSALRGTAVRARLHVRRLSGAGNAAAVAPRMRLLSQRRQGSSAPNELAATPGPALRFGQSTVWTMPTSWAEALLSGAAGGIGIGGGSAGYMGLMGPARWSSAMTLELTWRQ